MNLGIEEVALVTKVIDKVIVIEIKEYIATLREIVLIVPITLDSKI